MQLLRIRAKWLVIWAKTGSWNTNILWSVHILSAKLNYSKSSHVPKMYRKPWAAHFILTRPSVALMTWSKMTWQAQHHPPAQCQQRDPLCPSLTGGKLTAAVHQQGTELGFVCRQNHSKAEDWEMCIFQGDWKMCHHPRQIDGHTVYRVFPCACSDNIHCRVLWSLECTFLDKQIKWG